jgi:hypothetical protein
MIGFPCTQQKGCEEYAENDGNCTGKIVYNETLDQYVTIGGTNLKCGVTERFNLKLKEISVLEKILERIERDGKE